LYQSPKVVCATDAVELVNFEELLYHINILAARGQDEYLRQLKSK
jgi:hypothetical protein